MKFLKGTLLLAVLLFVSAQLSAQGNGSIMGAITDAKGEGIPGVSAQLDKTSFGAATDADGYYSILHVPAGEYLIIVSGVGYQSHQKRISVKGNQSIRVNISLDESVIQMAEVVVESESESQSFKKQGFSVEAIEVMEFQNQSIELNDILNQTPGIRVRQEGGLGARSSYAINGLSGRAIRFFLDGVPMDYFGSSYSVNNIPVSLIDRIEVFKGVVPVELSNDALGGAINLVTKANQGNMLEASYSFGSFNTHRVSLFGNWVDRTTGLTFKASAFYNYSDNNYKVWGKDIYVTDPDTYEVHRDVTAERFHDAFDSKAIKAEIGFAQKSWADQLFLGYLFSDLDKEIQHGPTMKVPFGEATYHQKVNMPYLTFRKFNFLTEGLELNLFTAYSRLVRSRVDTSRYIYNWYGGIDGRRTLGGEQTRTLNTLIENVWLNRVNLVYQLAPNHKLGYNYIFSDLVRNDSDPIITQKTEGYWAPQKLRKHTMGLVFHSEWLQSRLSTQAFAKWFKYSAEIKDSYILQGETVYETVPASTSGPGFGIAGSFQWTPSFSLNASLEQALRLPESDEVLGDGLNIQSTTTLRPEHSLNANLGFSVDLFKRRQSILNISANAFYRDVTDLIQQWQFEPGAFEYINFEKVQMTGVDGKIQYNWNKRLTINQTLSYLNPLIKSDKDEFGNENILYNTRLPNTPYFQSGTDLRLDLPDILQKGSRGFVYWAINYVAAFYRSSELIGEFNKDQIPAQFVNNFGMGYTFPKDNFSVSFDLHNLFNEQVFDNYAVQKPGRAAYIKLTYRLK